MIKQSGGLNISLKPDQTEWDRQQISTVTANLQKADEWTRHLFRSTSNRHATKKRKQANQLLFWLKTPCMQFTKEHLF